MPDNAAMKVLQTTGSFFREVFTMESTFYPVITVETSEELEVITAYCDEHHLEFDFLDCNQDKLPARVLLYISEEDFELFLDSIQ